MLILDVSIVNVALPAIQAAHVYSLRLSAVRIAAAPPATAAAKTRRPFGGRALELARRDRRAAEGLGDQSQPLAVVRKIWDRELSRTRRAGVP